MSKLGGEIIVNDAPHYRMCNCCGEKANKEINFRRIFSGGNSQGVIVALCDKCVEELVSKLGDRGEYSDIQEGEDD